MLTPFRRQRPCTSVSISSRADVQDNEQLMRSVKAALAVAEKSN
ncbi:hypothetical protein M5D96_005863 [Drosophila gunungcola]|uniref:Uncharacterized protein n=1 Tax=Drosophila gunungcola TaxID=103775 RepID=A0A9P9YR53_9MUSC|nr:hypothetical protein M5D96_005863 [Drosophila gunungcola]